MEDGKKRHEFSREKISELLAETFGNLPYDWQLDVAEAICMGLDAVVIAGTGAGKTLPFVMPVMLHKEKMVIIISPLIALQEDQVSFASRKKYAFVHLLNVF